MCGPKAASRGAQSVPCNSQRFAVRQPFASQQQTMPYMTRFVTSLFPLVHTRHRRETNGRTQPPTLKRLRNTTHACETMRATTPVFRSVRACDARFSHEAQLKRTWPTFASRHAKSGIQSSGPVVFAQHGQENCKSVVTPEAVPFDISAPASGDVNI
eukprot:3473174-Pleurochrysis_carterae.AAC.4